ncbi:MAG: hypothetical protein A4E43_01152 [Methanosaeta sp. PtaB.Bin005]|nr:MAG: hypothetical protein A4E43_01152 [Methanosaeta sp. PtaB.Bin005]
MERAIPASQKRATIFAVTAMPKVAGVVGIPSLLSPSTSREASQLVNPQSVMQIIAARIREAGWMPAPALRIPAGSIASQTPKGTNP